MSIDMDHVLAFFQGPYTRPNPPSHHIPFLYQAYWFHQKCISAEFK